jgi:hypothetical protein
MKLTGMVLVFLGFAQACWEQTKGSTNLAGPDRRDAAPAAATSDYAVFGAKPQQEALLRHQIQTMQPAILPLRVFFVPHWRYLDNARVSHLHVRAGYASAMFTHLPSRTVFIDADG